MRVLCPRATAADLEALVEAAARLERTAYRWRLLPLAAGDRVDLGAGFVLEAFATDHVVPSLGFHLHRRRKKLLAEHVGRSGQEIVALRERGVEVQHEIEELVLSYCGDTGAGVWALAPRLPESRLLMIECTFVGESQRGKAATYGHLHLDDLVAHRERLAGHEAILLHHLSRRHSAAELRRAVERLLPELAPRIFIWGEGAGDESEGTAGRNCRGDRPSGDAEEAV